MHTVRVNIYMRRCQILHVQSIQLRGNDVRQKGNANNGRLVACSQWLEALEVGGVVTGVSAK